MKAHTSGPRTPLPVEIADHSSLDQADWLDWDHWHAVEEYQDLVDGLSGFEANDDGSSVRQAEDGLWTARLTRQLRRHGMEIVD